MISSSDLALHRAGHCGKTETCVDDVYCNCACSRCLAQLCHRPGCDACGKIHVGDRRWIDIHDQRGRR